MKLYYRKEGEGPVVIILHGLYGSSDNWRSIGKRLAEDHTVYMVDLRNHGRSPFAAEHTYEAMKNDIAEFFEFHRIEKATLLGHSMGGKTAMWFAADYPEKIEKLVIADIAPIDYTLVAENSQFYLHRNILSTMQELNFDRIKERSDVDEFLAEHIGDERIRHFLLKSVAFDKNTRKYKWRVNVDALYVHLNDIVSGVNRRWFAARMPITVYPVIFIRGLKSNYITDESVPLVKEIYPDANIVDIPGAGHWLHAEKPKEFTKAVLLYC